MNGQPAHTIDTLIGNRVLAKIKSGTYTPYGTGDVMEIKIIEVSPSGNWVKIMNLNGNRFWRSISDIALIEVLKDLKDGKPLT